MKKFIIVCIVAAFATSCKKDYTCECTSTDTSGGKTHTTVDTFKASSKKKDAEAWCAALPKATYESNGTSTAADPMTCVLK
jgi:hypothetical protein